MYVSKINVLFGGGLNVLGFLIKLWTDLSLLVLSSAWYSMSHSFLQNFLISVFCSVISPLGVGVNCKPYLIKVSFVLLPIALFVSMKSFGLTGSFDAKSLEFGYCLGTKKSYFPANFFYYQDSSFSGVVGSY